MLFNNYVKMQNFGDKKKTKKKHEILFGPCMLYWALVSVKKKYCILVIPFLFNLSVLFDDNILQSDRNWAEKMSGFVFIYICITTPLSYIVPHDVG